MFNLRMPGEKQPSFTRQNGAGVKHGGTMTRGHSTLTLFMFPHSVKGSYTRATKASIATPLSTRFVQLEPQPCRRRYASVWNCYSNNTIDSSTFVPFLQRSLPLFYDLIKRSVKRN